MTEEIKEILEKPNVYSFNDECYLYFGDYNKLKYYITNLQKENENIKEIFNEIRNLTETFYDFSVKSCAEIGLTSDAVFCYHIGIKEALKMVKNKLNGGDE